MPHSKKKKSPISYLRFLLCFFFLFCRIKTEWKNCLILELSFWWEFPRLSLLPYALTHTIIVLYCATHNLGILQHTWLGHTRRPTPQNIYKTTTWITHQSDEQKYQENDPRAKALWHFPHFSSPQFPNITKEPFSWRKKKKTILQTSHEISNGTIITDQTQTPLEDDWKKSWLILYLLYTYLFPPSLDFQTSSKTKDHLTDKGKNKRHDTTNR